MNINQSTRKIYDEVRFQQKAIDGGQPIKYITNPRLLPKETCLEQQIVNPAGMICNQMSIGSNQIDVSNKLYIPELTNKNELIVQTEQNDPNDNVFNYSKFIGNTNMVDNLNDTLFSESTRFDKSDNMPGISINRMHILNKNPQELVNWSINNKPQNSTLEIKNLCMER